MFIHPTTHPNRQARGSHTTFEGWDKMTKHLLLLVADLEGEYRTTSKRGRKIRVGEQSICIIKARRVSDGHQGQSTETRDRLSVSGNMAKNITYIFSLYQALKSAEQNRTKYSFNL